MGCPRCGEQAAVGAVYCVLCGARLDEAPASDPVPTEVEGPWRVYASDELAGAGWVWVMLLRAAPALSLAVQPLLAAWNMTRTDQGHGYVLFVAGVAVVSGLCVLCAAGHRSALHNGPSPWRAAVPFAWWYLQGAGLTRSAAIAGWITLIGAALSVLAVIAESAAASGHL